jgi:hypothetical protein
MRTADISKDMAAQRSQGLIALDRAGLTWPNSNLRFEFVPDSSGGGEGDEASDPWCGARTHGPTRVSSGPDCGAYNCTLTVPIEASAHPSRRMHVSGARREGANECHSTQDRWRLRACVGRSVSLVPVGCSDVLLFGGRFVSGSIRRV